MTRLQELAAGLLGFFNERGAEGWRVGTWTDPGPPEARRLLEEVMNTGVADAWRYRFMLEALQVVANSESPEEDCLDSVVDGGELCHWLGSHVSRAAYVNRGVAEITGLPDLESFDILDVVRTGLYLERNDVYWTVLNSLRRLSVT